MMGFGEKLYSLRKKEGMSQEVLAEKLDTSRQAISKWENNNGYPETDKIIKLSKIFNVSVDYLLKDDFLEEESLKTTENIDKEDVFFIDKNTSREYLKSEKKSAFLVTLALGMVFGGLIPYFLFKNTFEYYFVIIGIMVAVGIGVIIKAAIIEDSYKDIKKKELEFEDGLLKNIKEEFELIKKRNTRFIIFGVCLFIFGGTILLVVEKGLVVIINRDYLYAICTFIIVLGGYFMIYYGSILESYEILVNNKDHINSLGVRIEKRFKKTIDKI